jgi:ubiquinone/menaquinone biosynthesis C-methylase UbiE
METPSTLTELRQFLRESLAAGRREHFGNVRESWTAAAEDYFWDEKHQTWRLDILTRHGVLPGQQRLLDLSSGCGQFVLLALRKGYRCEGLEPDPWRKIFVERKIDLSGYPPEWKANFHQGTGESLPFADDTFDYVTSFQTLEHVQDPARVIAEMIRVTRVGGMIHIMCPDYRSTFEGHYQLPWLPLFPRPLARIYLNFLRRPVKGLETIQYVTRPRILSWISLQETGKRFLVTDEERMFFENGLRRKGIPRVPGGYWLWRAWPIVRDIGRREFSVSLSIRILSK